MRLAKYIAHAGVASRRHAERLVTSGRVGVDGERVTDPARDVGERSDVTVDGRAITIEPHQYYLVNKPVGVLSTAHDPEGRPKVTDLVSSEARLYPVGRLDADTSGLVILTNDGVLANRLMHPRYEVDRTYRARVRGAVGERALARLRSGLELDDGRTAPAKVRLIDRGRESTVIELTIHEGRRRQVRRMCKAVGHPVESLRRIRYGPLGLGDLRPGEARRLKPDEVEHLCRGAGDATPSITPGNRAPGGRSGTRAPDRHREGA